MRPQFGFTDPAAYRTLYRHFQVYNKKLFAIMQTLLRAPRFILDLGCGTGDFTYILSQEYSNATITGVDLSPSYIAYASEQVTTPNTQFVVAPAQAVTALPWASKVDTVFIKGSFHLFESDLPLASFCTPQFRYLEQIVIIEKTARSLASYPAPSSARLARQHYVSPELSSRRVAEISGFDIRATSYGERLSIPREDFLSAFQARQLSYLATVSDTELSEWIDKEARLADPVTLFEENVANVYYPK